MGEVTRVDIDALRAAQPGVRQIASGMQLVLLDLVRALDTEGRCWGGDETGQRFDAAYVPAARTLRQMFGELRDGAEAIARSLATVADRADAVESRTSDRLGVR